MLLIVFISRTLKFLNSYILDLVSVFIFLCALLNVNDYFQSDVERTIDGLVIGMNNSHVKSTSVFIPRKKRYFPEVIAISFNH